MSGAPDKGRREEFFPAVWEKVGPKRGVKRPFWLILVPGWGASAEAPRRINVEIPERLKKVAGILDVLRDEWILVEGQRDRKALSALGLTNILTVSGNLRQSCAALSGKNAVRAYVLTDLDRRGHQLAMMARDELEGLSIKADISVRFELAYALGIRNFEDAKRAYDKLKEEQDKGEMNG